MPVAYMRFVRRYFVERLKSDAVGVFFVIEATLRLGKIKEIFTSLSAFDFNSPAQCELRGVGWW